jgi:CRISPR-associated protein Cas8a1/Csx13
MIRHDAFKTETRIQESTAGLLMLHFALVGTLSLAVNRGVGILLVPDVDDLIAFTEDRPALTPVSVQECQVGGAGNAALQAQVRLRMRGALDQLGVASCWAMKLTPTSWNKKHKTRVFTCVSDRKSVPRFQPVDETGDDRLLHRFAVALAELPPRVVTRTTVETQGRGRHRRSIERERSFATDSIVRPLVAENLAAGKPWYAGFVRLMTALDGNGNPLRNRLFFERKGLHDMTDNPLFWDHDGEAAVVAAVHDALRGRHGQIAEENKTNVAAMRNRFKGEYDRWRLAFAGSKTADQFRHALCDLFSRSRANRTLQESWRQLLPMIDGRRWQLARDLSLLALASYAGRGPAGEPEEAAQTESNV